MENPYLVGKRIYLRPLEINDTARLVPWLNDPEIMRAIPWRGPVNLSRGEQSIQDLYAADPPRCIMLGIVLKVDEALLGVTYLREIDWIDRIAETGILIGAKKYWNRGLGTEAKNLIIDYAFRTLNLASLRAVTLFDNPRAIASLVKQGYREAGRFRKARFREGEYRDEIVMELLREDWGGPPEPLDVLEQPQRAKPGGTC